jgi:hypothetical protein
MQNMNKTRIKETESLKMDRDGEFRLRATGPSHCGVDENLTIRYHMVCLCDNKLDGRGFLFDQLNVDSYFQGIRTTTLSCEQLCVQCGKELISRIKVENPGCVIRKMTLTLAPAPYKASMTFDWEDTKSVKKRKPFIDFHM